MRQVTREIEIETYGKGLFEFTAQAETFLRGHGLREALLTIFCRHTSASLLIQENADPDVVTDLKTFFETIAPEGGQYIHDSEGADDMPAHIRAALTASQLSIPVIDGRMVLGTWQGIYLFEHRRAPHRRRIILHAIGV